jgi:hypothetical protein
MLKVSRRKPALDATPHVCADVFDRLQLRRACEVARPISAVILGFFLSGLTPPEQDLLLSTLRAEVGDQVKLVIYDAQWSAFSTRKEISRAEVQRRTLPSGAEVPLYKRNLLPHDVREALSAWGTPVRQMATRRYFCAGIASLP